MSTATLAPAPVSTRLTQDGAVVTFDDGLRFEFRGYFGSNPDWATMATESRAETRAHVVPGAYTLSENGSDAYGPRTVADSIRYDNRDDAEVAAQRRQDGTGIETWTTFGEVEEYAEPPFFD